MGRQHIRHNRDRIRNRSMIHSRRSKEPRVLRPAATRFLYLAQRHPNPSRRHPNRLRASHRHASRHPIELGLRQGGRLLFPRLRLSSQPQILIFVRISDDGHVSRSAPLSRDAIVRHDGSGDTADYDPAQLFEMAYQVASKAAEP